MIPSTPGRRGATVLVTGMAAATALIATITSPRAGAPRPAIPLAAHTTRATTRSVLPPSLPRGFVCVLTCVSVLVRRGE